MPGSLPQDYRGAPATATTPCRIDMSTLNQRNLRKRLGGVAMSIALGILFLAAPPLVATILPGTGLVGGIAMAATAPSVDQVEAAIARGDMDGAHRMLQQVIAANPNSARAHYLDAQVLEHSHRYADALSALQAARRVDPSLGFTDKAKFEAVERRITAEAGGRNGSARMNGSNGAATDSGALQQTALSAAPTHHRPGIGMWIGILVIGLLVVLSIRWAMRKRQTEEEAGATDIHRDALKQATALQQSLRAIKLDLKLSTAPEKDAWLRDADTVEGEIRALIDELTSASDGAERYSSPETSPPYRLADLTRRVDRLKAVSEGRPDPMLQNASTASLSSQGSRSAYADEADRLSGNQTFGNQPYTNQPPQQQPTVIVQQPQQGGFGAGMGGLMTGVLLGEMMGGHRDREVIVERDGPRQDRPEDGGGNAGNQGQNAGFDFGNGGDKWDDGSGGNDGGFDLADNTDNDWDNS